MNFDDLSNSQLMTLHDDLRMLHLLGQEARFFLGDATRTINAGNSIIISDKRMNDLVWNLVVETYQEIQKRFSGPLKDPK